MQGNHSRGAILRLVTFVALIGIQQLVSQQSSDEAVAPTSFAGAVEAAEEPAPPSKARRLTASGAPLCATFEEAWPVRKYAALGWKKHKWLRGIPIPGFHGEPMLGFYTGLLRWLQRRGWQETVSIGEAPLLFAQFKVADRVPWFTMQPNNQPIFVTSFPLRSVFSHDRGCVLYEKQSLYQCLVDASAAEGDDSAIADFFPRTFIYDPSRPATLNQFYAMYDDVVNTDKRYSSSKWLVKPGRDAYGGAGIEVFSDKHSIVKYVQEEGATLPRGTFLVVQKLLDHVFTVEGRRFDIRIYVLLTSFKPLAAFWSPYSMVVRLAGKVAHSERHTYLTNFSLHHDKDALWNVKELLDYLRQRDEADVKAVDREFSHQPGTLMKLFHQKTLPSITQALGKILSLPNRFVHRKNAFQMLGCDFMLDERDLRGWFIECNGRPLWFSAANREKFGPIHDRMAEQIMRKIADPGCETEDDMWIRVPYMPVHHHEAVRPPEQP